MFYGVLEMGLLTRKFWDSGFTGVFLSYSGGIECRWGFSFAGYSLGLALIMGNWLPRDERGFLTVLIDLFICWGLTYVGQSCRECPLTMADPSPGWASQVTGFGDLPLGHGRTARL